MNAKSQRAKVLRHLKRRTITQMQAWDLYRIPRLAPRICELRQEGKIIPFDPKIKVGDSYVSQYRLVESK